jgi:hypothetical protein
MFIQSWVERRRLKHVTYNGEVKGYFLDECRGRIADLNNAETVRRKTTFDLLGLAVEGMHEFSFIFNNSDTLSLAGRIGQ